MQLQNRRKRHKKLGKINLKRILVAFGTRPEAIKMVPIIRELNSHPGVFDVKVCITAQHREMLDQVLDVFKIKADYDLDIMKQGQDLSYIASEILNRMAPVLKEASPDFVFVHGDTLTSAMVALSGFFHKVPVGHVEAGLRTHNIQSPWPEEMNRQITGRLATYHFAPTPLAKENLLKENIGESRIFVTGNTVIDTLIYTSQRLNSDTHFQQQIAKQIVKNGYSVERIFSGRKLVLITGHRRENFGQGFKNICQAIRDVSIEFPEVDFVYPVHLNPNVQKPVNEILTNDAVNNIFLLPPLEYFPFVYLMSKSYLILTDSGGIQEEAPGLNKPVLVMRETTERPEAINAGTAILVGTNKNTIMQHFKRLLTDEKEYQKMASAHNPYGDGLASKRIIEHLKKIVE